MDGSSETYTCPKCATEALREIHVRNLRVCAACGFHDTLPPTERLDMLFGEDSAYERLFEAVTAEDPLNFEDKGVAYPERLAQAQAATGESDAVAVAEGDLDGRTVVCFVMNFHFLGGSMGGVVGERVVRAFERAAERQLPVIGFPASGGARMQEGILSLMQMAKTTGALAHFQQCRQPFIAVLTHPTMGGVMASFASQADVTLAEPKARLGFTGPRVIEQTTGEKLPKGFQRSEYLLEHGFLDQIVPRHELREKLLGLLALFPSA